MPVITCQDRQLHSHGDSVLECLEKAGISMPSNCRTGHCQICVTQLKSGNLAPEAQWGLSSRQKQLNYFLSCKFVPQWDIEISLLDQDRRCLATLVDKVALHDRVLRVRLQAPIHWRAGQYLTLWRSKTEGRVYSIASRPEEGFIELHVRRRKGVVSGWLENNLNVGDQCQISLPRGECYYSPAMPRQPVVMVGIGTGMAPVFGVLKQALAERHHGQITVYAVAGAPSQLYLIDELTRVCRRNPSVQLQTVVRRNPDKLSGVTVAEVDDLIRRRHADMRGHLVYLCGAPDSLENLYQQCFLQGAHQGDIFVDAFDYDHRPVSPADRLPHAV